MTPKNQSKRAANRRVSQNKTPIPVISMTQTEAFERNLSMQSDAAVLRGKLLLNFTFSTGTPVALLPIHPGNSGWGTRVTDLASIYSRWRPKYLKFKYLGSGSSNLCAIGVLDDGISGITGEAPTTLSDVAELRSSGTSFVGQTVPNYISWEPVDKKTWLFTQSDGTDARFQSAGAIYAAGATGGGILVEVDYCFVFKGATNAAAF